MKQTNLLKGILAIVALLCSTHAWAYDFEVDNIQYTVISLDELTVEVSGLSDESVIEVVIPETVEYRGRTLTVISIGNYAFCDCIRLESVTIGNSVTSIGSSAFSGCSGLTEVTIPESVTTIGNYAFSGCLGLTSTLTIPNSVTKIGDYAFYQCSRLTEVTIGESVATIGSYAFQDCKRLTEVNFNATACTLAGSSSSNRAFYSCDNISTFNFGNNVTIIPDYLCYNLTYLTKITPPNSVTSIGDYAFYGCTGLTGTLTIPNSVTSIGDYAFYGCSGLTGTLTIPNSVTSIGDYAFYGCSGLTGTLTISNSVSSIGSSTFYDCSGLTEVTIGNSVTTIGDYAFYGCASLKELIFPDNVTSLGSYAFDGCSGIESLFVGTGLEYLFGSDYGGNGGSYRYVYYYPLLWRNGITTMNSIILKDGESDFSVRGYGDFHNNSANSPTFSNITLGYYYIGRPLIDIKSWKWSNYTYNIKTSQPYGSIMTLEIGGYCTDVPYFYQSIEYLILGENVETYEVENIYQGNLKAIICRSAVPPTLSGTFENSTYINAVVYVPIGSKATYEATESWKSFWDIQELDMQSIPPGYSDALQSVTAYGQANVIGYYSIDGKKVSTPQRGINIIRYSDGTTRKVLMK